MRIFQGVVAILFLVQFHLCAQSVEGVITYKRTTDWILINSALPWMTSEDIDRDKLTWGSYERRGQNYFLHFKGKKSVYIQKEETSTGGYSRKKSVFLLIRDHKKKITEDWIETLDKKYIIKDNIPTYRWKIYNEIKEVAGYLCMRAETYDPIKNQRISAWYSDAIPFFGGPEGYSGLPGMILELDINNGACVITATKVDLENAEVKLPVPKKMKGKEIGYAEYNEKIRKYIETSYEGEKNPFWRIRY